MVDRNTFTQNKRRAKNGADGLQQVNTGLDDASKYLTGLSEGEQAKASGWYIPTEAIQEDEFQQSLQTYMSNNRKFTTVDIVFKENPYSEQALEKIPKIEQAVERAVKGTGLENAKFAINGITSTYADVNKVSTCDYKMSVMWMLIGITIILIILFRSFIMPLYIVASLLLTYYASLGFTEFIFVKLLGYSAISWAVPFFSFVTFTALGVDYSIFLMSRFNEYRDLSVREAMIMAMRNMGTVIVSAVIILSGTFAALYPSGVLTMLEVTTVILCGLLLYAFVMLTLFVPVMVKIFGEANWWPFISYETKQK